MPKLLLLAAAAVREFFGRDPLNEDPSGFEARVWQRVQGERTYVLEDNGELAFKVDVGARSEFGAELEGAYTVPSQRHKGHAILSLGQISRHLLSSLPRLTLHVEDDSSLARMARKVGYVPGRAQRLVVME
jgi:predicted GNAT family acetyltransferase